MSATLLRLSLLSLLVVGFLLFGSEGRLAVASTNGSAVSVRPSDVHGRLVAGPDYFVVQLAAGRRKPLYALLTNHASHAITVSIAAVDASTDTRGNISYKLPQAKRTQVGRWLHLASKSLYLRKRESVVLHCSLNVPKGVHSGRYVGALTVFVPAPSRPAPGHDVVTLQVRLADAIIVSIGSK